MKDYFTKEQIERFNGAVISDSPMGAIIAYGGGFDKPKGLPIIVRKSIELAGKETPRMLFLPTAHKDVLEDREEVIEAFQKAGIQTDILLVTKATDEEITAKISSADIIYETGGNLDFLTKAWSSRGVYPLIHGAFNRGAVLVGVSSGAMCWGERGYDDFAAPVWRITSSFPYFGKKRGYDFREAAGILPFCICPHFDNIAWHTYAAKARKLDIPSLCIDNSAGIVFRGGRFEVFTEMPFRSAYLYYPELGINGVNVKKHPELLNNAYAHRMQTYVCKHSKKN